MQLDPEGKSDNGLPSSLAIDFGPLQRRNRLKISVGKHIKLSPRLAECLGPPHDVYVAPRG